MEPWELTGHPYLEKLGPDVVISETTVEQLITHMNQKKFQRRRLKTLLLDQGFFAGVGNYLRSEILFTSSLHPDRTVASLSDEEKTALSEQALFLSRQSYDVPGITVNLELYDQLRDLGQSRGRARHWVFTRNELPCHRCAALILHTRPEVGGLITALNVNLRCDGYKFGKLVTLLNESIQHHPVPIIHAWNVG